MFELGGKVALVTGASRGIGKAIAMELAKHGARVLVHYGHSQKEAEDVAFSIQSAPGQADVLGADLSTPDGPFHAAQQVRELTKGALDIVVLNAGVRLHGQSPEEPPVQEIGNGLGCRVSD